jgi:hypothetical protein
VGRETEMLVKTQKSGMVWVDWPPEDHGEFWLLGASPDGRYLTAYRVVDGRLEAVEWEELARKTSEASERDAMH